MANLLQESDNFNLVVHITASNKNIRLDRVHKGEDPTNVKQRVAEEESGNLPQKSALFFDGKPLPESGQSLEDLGVEDCSVLELRTHA